ncbi:hypothetical protein [Desulfomicrobium apsheronum]|nr:hypothetical protein [Desulfomicrobium apsheronum]
MEKWRKPTEKQTKAKKSGVYASVAPERIVIDLTKFKVEQKEA